jgi:hypothetical protein
MRFILLERQIDGFRSESKAEKKRLRKLAQNTKTNKIIIVSFLLVLTFGVIPLVKQLEFTLFGTELWWIEWCMLLPTVWLFGLLYSGLNINPKIDKILKEKQTEPEN